MKNQIVSSYFERGNKCRTLISNPSARVFCLMEGISTRVKEFPNNDWQFIHSDIGTMEDMQALFLSLDACP